MSPRVELPIAGLVFEPRAVIADERGAVLHHLRADSPLLPRFGEVYFSTIRQGRVKAWKRHRRIAQNLSVPVGAVRVVVYDDRADSPTRTLVCERVLDRSAHGVLHVPAGLWYGFFGVGPGESVIVNCVEEMHDPAESERLAHDAPAFPYRWPAENIPG